jgi:peptidoglycan/LPS O-acetylase OafA/YrhL
MLVGVAIIGWLTLLAPEYETLGLHVLGAALFISNFIYWMESGYFDVLAETKPLLHLWSLGIEEQFYIILPLLLMALPNSNRKPIVIISSLALCLFAVNLYITDQNSSTAFYLLPTRAWELLLGVFVAQIHIFSETRSRDPKLNSNTTYRARMPWGIITQNVLSLLGIFLVLSGFFLIDDTTAFPGAWALLPCLGTALVIAAGPTALVNRYVLAHPVAVYIGLLSYPIYLWHWPVLTIPRIVQGHELYAGTKIALIIISAGLAWLTLIFIERPLRASKKKSLVTTCLIASMLVTGTFGMMVALNSGMPGRTAATSTNERTGSTSIYEYRDYIAKQSFPCIGENALINSAESWCNQTHENGLSEVAIIGDSHGRHVFIGFAEAFPELQIVNFMHLGLPTAQNPNFAPTIEHLLKSQKIRTVVISAAWGRDNTDMPDGLFRLVTDLVSNGKKVVLLDDVPFFRHDADACKHVRRFRKNTRCSETLEESPYMRRYRVFQPQLLSIARSSPSVELISTTEMFCDNQGCAMHQGNNLYYRDQHHLNILGSRFVGQQLRLLHPEAFLLSD